MIKITIKVFFLRFKPTVVSSLLYLVPLPRTFRISFSSDIRWYFLGFLLTFLSKRFISASVKPYLSWTFARAASTLARDVLRRVRRFPLSVVE